MALGVCREVAPPPAQRGSWLSERIRAGGGDPRPSQQKSAPKSAPVTHRSVRSRPFFRQPGMGLQGGKPRANGCLALALPHPPSPVGPHPTPSPPVTALELGCCTRRSFETCPSAIGQHVREGLSFGGLHLADDHFEEREPTFARSPKRALASTSAGGSPREDQGCREDRGRKRVVE